MSASKRQLCELIDADGADLPALAARQQQRRHVDGCADCADDRALQRALRVEALPRAGDDALVARLVQGVLAAEADAGGGRGGARAGRSSAARWLTLPAAAGVLLGVSAVAAAALWTGARLLRADPPASEAAGAGRPAGAAKARDRRPAPARAAAPPAPAPPAVEAMAPPATAPASASLTPAVGGPPRGRGEGAGRAPAAARAETAVARPTAAALFGEGNRLRHGGDYAAAAAAYERLHREFPGTREGLAARVILGQLALDRLAQPGRARALFDSYLAADPRGSLAEEARLGRAQALETSGHAAEERAAWLELVARHPRSVHADEARRRLRALGGAPAPAPPAGR